MEHIDLKNDYFFKINIEKEKLLTIIENLDNCKWIRNGTGKSAFKLGMSQKKQGIYEISKVIDNKVVFEENCRQRHVVSKYNKKKFLMDLKEFNDIIYSSDIMTILTNYFNGEPFVTKVEILHSEYDCNFNQELPKQMWHIDYPKEQFYKNKKFIKLFIPLCDVTEENGCTKIIKGSRENLPKDYKFSPKINEARFNDEYIFSKYSEKDLINVTSKFGEAILVRTDGFHKGGFVKKGYRTMVIVEYNLC